MTLAVTSCRGRAATTPDDHQHAQQDVEDHPALRRPAAGEDQQEVLDQAEAQTSWLEMVDIIAASTAASTSPVMNGCSTAWAITSTTVSGLPRPLVSRWT